MHFTVTVSVSVSDITPHKDQQKYESPVLCVNQISVSRAYKVKTLPCHEPSNASGGTAGNEAWPIGVTSIGIHERSSREKISHVMNTGGAAHIMNDEATRKYLQAMKRLLTTMQWLNPTDPSRCMEFDGFKNVGRGAAGGGSDRLVRPSL